MANALGIDLGQVYKTSEAVKSMKMDREDRESARQRAQTVNALRGNAIGDDGSLDQEAMGEFVAFAPDEAKQLIDTISAMDTREREAMQERVDTIGRVAAYIRNSENPEQAYRTARMNLNPDIAANMPEQYDPNFVEMGLARAREIDDMLANPDKVTIGAEDRLYKDGQVVESATSSAELNRRNSRGNALIRAQSDGPGRLKSSDTNAIYRMAGELFGGLFDEEGNMRALDPTTRSQVQAVVDEASRMYANGEAQTHAAAVTQAARKQGIEVPNLGGQGVPQGGGGNLDLNQLVDMYTE